MNEIILSPKKPHQSEELAMLQEVLEMLRSIDSRLVRIETLVEVHLGEGGTLAKLEDQVNGINHKILFASGGAGVAFWALNKFLGIR